MPAIPCGTSEVMDDLETRVGSDLARKRPESGTFRDGDLLTTTITCCSVTRVRESRPRLHRSAQLTFPLLARVLGSTPSNQYG